MTHFPRNMDPQSYDEYRLKPELWQEPFLALWREKGQGGESFFPYKDGSNLIACMNEAWILKVFPPFLRHQWESERLVMQHLDGQLTLPIPRFFGAGEYSGYWTYIIMSRLSGVTLDTLWPRLLDEDKAAILRDIGSIMARVHALPAEPLKTLPPMWSEFLPRQAAGCRARHERLGMPPWFLERVEDFVRESLSLIPSVFDSVILTGEYTPFNLLVDDRERVQKIAGMIDFGDAMTGYNEYDLLGPLLFSCEGKADFVNALLEGYGVKSQDRDKNLRRRLFVLQILHRYSDFDGQVRIADWNKRVKSMEELENLIWPMT